ncbi:hypothetical protein DAEQUDRAFT_724974 [Daedalea quercina L-15889]|uniref:Uncharacterized protein n=1 Tax=Daedalea quercina L-15889 TaxID=1314783 RepID=A0A165RJC1_9APHY|nr:hypothetical protein DAEQUDRAFT_724974 [Daedalea quercina L-15889]
MPFSFSFTLSVPGLTNPFSNPPEPETLLPQPRLANLDAGSDKEGYRALNRRVPSPQPPLSRKRGWVPSAPEYSSPAASPTSTSGYLDTPAKYREMASAYNDEDGVEEMVADLPPPKRRRTLAGSIVSTALSAALIGTAVGLTVYRLWRDRGKAPEPLPPPPYEQGEWVPPKPDPSPAPVPVTQVTPPTPRSSRKNRHVAGRRTHRQRKVAQRAGPGSIASQISTAARDPIPPEFNFGELAPVEPGEGDVDDQMSWMGGRLAALIAEGQRALGKEVVVMSEAQEDEEDDGADTWVEEDDGHSVASSTRTSRRRWNANPPPYPASRRGSPFPSASPHRTTFDLAPSYNGSPSMSIQSSPRHRAREASVESDALASCSFREDDSQWQTPELKDAMERARMRYRRDHA